MSACLFPGSFDPPTNGHLDLIRRLSALFDRVYVCQMENIAKKAFLPPERRTALLREACRGLANVEVIQGAGFTVHMARSCGAKVIARGVRGSQDFAYEIQIAKANAQRDIAIATSQAEQEANAVKVDADKLIAEQNAELSVQQAEMQIRADTKRAEADAAYSIQQESQRKTIEITRANADIARREKEAEMAEKEIAIRERQLDAEVRKQADAMKYKAEKEAEADLIRRQREADAKRYEAQREAEARKAEADAARYAMEQEAEGIRAKGLAEDRKSVV